MTWGVSTARRRPGELLTRGDVCHLHADRDGAERCGAAASGSAGPGEARAVLRAGVPGAVVPVGHVGRRAAAPAGRAGASGAVGRAAADRGGGAGRGHDPGRGGCARRRYRPAAAPGRGPVMTAPRPGPMIPGYPTHGGASSAQADPGDGDCRAVTIRLTGELRPGRGHGRRGAGPPGSAGSAPRPRPSSAAGTPARRSTSSAATAAPAGADAPSAPDPSIAVASDRGRPRGAAWSSARRPPRRPARSWPSLSARAGHRGRGPAADGRHALSQALDLAGQSC